MGRNSGMFMAAFGLMPILIYGAPVLLLAFLLIYVLEHVDGKRSGERDPMLGVKVLLTLLMTFSFQVAVLGTAWLLASLFQDSPGDELKTALGAILGGLLAGAPSAFVWFNRFHGDANQRVRRQALGLNAILAGLVYTVSITMAMVIIVGGSAGASWPLSFAIVYLGAGVALAVPLLGKSRLAMPRTPAPPLPIMPLPGGDESDDEDEEDEIEEVQTPDVAPPSPTPFVPPPPQEKSPRKVQCHQCGLVYTVKPEQAGKVFRCKCGHKMRIPIP